MILIDFYTAKSMMMLNNANLTQTHLLPKWHPSEKNLHPSNAVTWEIENAFCRSTTFLPFFTHIVKSYPRSLSPVFVDFFLTYIADLNKKVFPNFFWRKKRQNLLALKPPQFVLMSKKDYNCSSFKVVFQSYQHLMKCLIINVNKNVRKLVVF